MQSLELLSSRPFIAQYDKMAITLLTSPPPALTPPELQDLSQSTPATFEGIAPLLRHFEEQVEIRVEPAFEGFSGGTGSVYITEE